MNFTPGSLGTDEWDAPKLFTLLYLLLGFGVVSYYFFNSATQATAAGKFVMLYIIGFIFILFDYIIKWKKGEEKEFPDSVLYEKETMFGELPSIVKKGIMIGTIFLGLIIFWRVQTSSLYAIVSADMAYSTVDLGNLASALLSFFSASSEDLFFFGIMFPTIYSILYYFTKNYWFSLIVSVFLAPTNFMLWHMGVYSTSQVALQSVWLYGLFSTSFVAVFRNVAGLFPIHGFNNMGIAVRLVGG